MVQSSLQVIKEWNPDWNPKFFMIDHDVKEQNAIYKVYEDAKQLLCLFHRKQAWARHLHACKDAKLREDHELIEHELEYWARAGTEEKFEER